jgi:putative transcriptional regulator
LIQERKKNSMTQQNVADNAMIARSTYAMIESGERNASVPNAKKISKVLGFNWTIFFEDECHDSCNIFEEVI